MYLHHQTIYICPFFFLFLNCSVYKSISLFYWIKYCTIWHTRVVQFWPSFQRSFSNHWQISVKLLLRFYFTNQTIISSLYKQRSYGQTSVLIEIKNWAIPTTSSLSFQKSLFNFRPLWKYSLSNQKSKQIFIFLNLVSKIYE